MNRVEEIAGVLECRVLLAQPAIVEVDQGQPAKAPDLPGVEHHKDGASAREAEHPVQPEVTPEAADPDGYHTVGAIVRVQQVGQDDAGYDAEHGAVNHCREAEGSSVGRKHVFHQAHDCKADGQGEENIALVLVEQHPVEGQIEADLGHGGEAAEAKQVEPPVMCVEEAFHQQENEQGEGNASNVAEKTVLGEQHIADMVDQHGDDRHKLDHIAGNGAVAGCRDGRIRKHNCTPIYKTNRLLHRFDLLIYVSIE